jgi:hypothetical protein
MSLARLRTWANAIKRSSSRGRKSRRGGGPAPRCVEKVGPRVEIPTWSIRFAWCGLGVAAERPLRLPAEKPFEHAAGEGPAGAEAEAA